MNTNYLEPLGIGSAQFSQRKLTNGSLYNRSPLITRLDLTKEENIMLFVCSEAVESNLVKLEPRAIILRHTSLVQPISILSGKNSFCN